MSDLAIILVASTTIVAVVVAHHWLERYITWRAWDKQRRAERRLHIALATMRVRFREMELDIGLTLLPAARKMTRAMHELGRAFRNVAA